MKVRAVPLVASVLALAGAACVLPGPTLPPAAAASVRLVALAALVTAAVSWIELRDAARRR